MQFYLFYHPLPLENRGQQLEAKIADSIDNKNKPSNAQNYDRPSNESDKLTQI